MNTSVQLLSGKYWDFSSPHRTIDSLDIYTIAHALSNICRFTGHTRKFYSVAQHSVLCSHIGNGAHYEKLMHDIAEAMLNDIASPIKRELPDYQKMERLNESVIFRHFMLPTKIAIIDSCRIRVPNMPEDVTRADNIMLVTEKRDLMPPCSAGRPDWDWAKDILPAPGKINPWGHARAKHNFLARFFELCPERFLTKKRWKHVLSHRFMAFISL